MLVLEVPDEPDCSFNVVLEWAEHLVVDGLIQSAHQLCLLLLFLQSLRSRHILEVDDVALFIIINQLLALHYKNQVFVATVFFILVLTFSKHDV